MLMNQHVLRLVLPRFSYEDVASLSQVCRAYRTASDTFISLERTDFSRGSERHAIPCENAWDSSKLPSDFTYMASPKLRLTVIDAGCSCCSATGPCASGPCPCWHPSSFGQPALPGTNCIDTREECGPSCTCPLQCPMRATQGGAGARLAIVKSQGKGWGVVARQDIPPGAFVAEYVGEYVTTPEARHRLAEYDRLTNLQAQLQNVPAARGQHLGASLPSEAPAFAHEGGTASGAPTCAQQLDACVQEQGAVQQRSRLRRWNGHALMVVRETLPNGITLRANIDATLQGNVARFFNHSCDGGNLRHVLVHRRGTLLPAVALFASRHICSGEEITFAYGAPNPGPDPGDQGMQASSCNPDVATLPCHPYLPAIPGAAGGHTSQTTEQDSQSVVRPGSYSSGPVAPARVNVEHQHDTQGHPQSRQQQGAGLHTRCLCGATECLGWMPNQDAA